MFSVRFSNIVFERLDAIAQSMFFVMLGGVGFSSFVRFFRLGLRSFLEFLLLYLGTAFAGWYCVARGLFGGLGSVDGTDPWGLAEFG